MDVSAIEYLVWDLAAVQTWPKPFDVIRSKWSNAVEQHINGEGESIFSTLGPALAPCLCYQRAENPVRKDLTYSYR